MLVLSESQTIQMKAMEWCFHVISSCKQFKVVLAFKFVDET